MGLTVKELIEQLQEHDGEKLVFIEDTSEGTLVKIRGVYTVKSYGISNKQVYLGMVD